MIVSDTTSVNVGWKNGIVTRLQSRLRNETNEVPQFIGCQHHILDRALRIIMDEYFGNLLTKDYDKLKHDFEQGEFELEAPSDWRDDMRFSHHLIDVYSYYQIHCRFPLRKSAPQNWKKTFVNQVRSGRLTAAIKSLDNEQGLGIPLHATDSIGTTSVHDLLLAKHPNAEPIDDDVLLSENCY
ncbi:hypothetical protein GJ496_003542 [Pomphorhynchus laevis]|nr:hypothetical protein GJ496_003542 [Pomphorhynchus laevis]